MKDKRKKIEVCETNIIHEGTVNKAKGELYEEIDYKNLSEFFKIFADGTRLKIINALLDNEMCVCDISCLINMNQSAVSHQLRVLKQMRLVKYRRDGKVIYYSLNDKHINDLFNIGMEHLNEEKEQ